MEASYYPEDASLVGSADRDHTQFASDFGEIVSSCV